MKPAIFLDRDGVIIENVDTYVRSWSDVQIYPQALEALVKFNKVPYHFVIVTNQSAIGRGIITAQVAGAINGKLIETIVKAGGRINAVFMCPHAPDHNCTCRKPQSGLLLKAAHFLNINLKRSIMIGDAFTDLQAASSAGVKVRALVKTGRGLDQLTRKKEVKDNKPFLIYDDLLSALTDLLS